MQPKDIPEWPTKCQPKETQQGNDAAHDSMLEYFYPLKSEVKQIKSGCHVQTGPHEKAVTIHFTSIIYRMSI